MNQQDIDHYGEAAEKKAVAQPAHNRFAHKKNKKTQLPYQSRYKIIHPVLYATWGSEVYQSP